jgi:large subunit ribosomal protein L24
MAGLKIHKGDRVQVLSGKDRGKQGNVSHVLPDRNRVIVDGINVVKRHTKARTMNEAGGIIDKDLPIHVSNVALVCSSCGPTRVGYRIESDGKKVRVCRKCGGTL